MGGLFAFIDKAILDRLWTVFQTTRGSPLFFTPIFQVFLKAFTKQAAKNSECKY